MEEDQHPQNVQLQKTIPVMADQLLVMSQVVADGFRTVEKIIQADQETGQSLLQHVDTLHFKACEAEKHLSQLNHGAQGFVDAYNNTMPQIPPSSTNLVPPQPEIQTIDICDRNIIPLYIPNANLHSIEEIYEEWYHGLIEGLNGRRGPAMRDLEE